MIKTIVVSLDGSPLAEEMLPYVEDLASRLGVEVKLLQAIPGLAETLKGSHIALDIAQAAVEEDRVRADSYLQGVADRLRAKGIGASVVVEEGAAGPVILQHVDDESLVCITTHGRSGLRRTLSGSVADHVIRNAHRPVFVLRPGG